ncbi:MAG TPA: TonB-dependent receptor plug domain-containing protein, partial [Terriglobales bacterium]|nr:TonB-dependent receptor plug domain-containing protein [Terriglobales bacterium]
MKVVFAVAILMLDLTMGVRAQTQANKADCPPDTSNSQTDCSKSRIEPHKEVIAVTGTYTPVPVENIDRSIDVIDTRADSLLYDNWVDYLHADPSIDLRQRGPNDVQADLSIRGSTFGQTLVLLNGLRLNDAQSSHHNMDQPIPTPSLERIEVLRGAGSSFYGSDAVGGSVNFITGPPKYSEIRAGSAVGNFGINQQTASAALVRAKWDEQIGIERDFSSGFRPDRDYRNFSAFSNSGLQTALGRSLVMLAYSDKPFGADQFYGNFNSWERTKAWFAGLEQELGKNTEFDLGYRRHTDFFVLFRDLLP